MDVLKAMKTRLEVAADGVGGTDLEKKVKAATSLENWPATNTQLHELSAATNDYSSYKEIMNLLWKRMAEPARNWRTIYKTLVLLEHLLRFGSPRVVEEARDRQFLVRQLTDFHYKDEDTHQDRGSGIREKAGGIVALLADNAQLEEVRRTAAANLHKFVGVSNAGHVVGGARYGGGGSGHGSDGRYDDSGFGGGAGAFGVSVGGGSASASYDEYVSRGSDAKSKGKSGGDQPASSPYDEADADVGEKKKKKKKKVRAEEGAAEGEAAADTPADPYAAAAATEEAPAGSAKKKKKKNKEGKKAAEEAPADEGFGDFTTASSPAAAAAAPQAAQMQQQQSQELSFDNFGGSVTAPAPAAASRPAAGGDLLDMFAASSIDNSNAWGASSAAHSGPVDFLSAAPAPAQKQASPSIFDQTSSSSSRQQQQQQQKAQPSPTASIPLNEHNNADAFSSFVAGHKPAAPAPAASAASAQSKAAPKKAGDNAWDNNLVDLGALSSKPSAGSSSAPAPFIAGSSVDPFNHLANPQQRMAMQQQRQQPQQQMGGMGFGMPPQMAGMGMMGGGPMGMGMGGMGPMGGMGQMGGMGMGMMQPQMGMGMGMAPMGMGGMGMGMGMQQQQPGFGFPQQPKKADHSVFF